MHLLKPALLLAVFLLVGASSMADELTSEATPLSPVVSDPTAPEDPSKWAYPPDVTKIDPSCQNRNTENFHVVMDSLFWRIEHGGSHQWALNSTLVGNIRKYTDDLDLGFQLGPRLTTAYNMTEEGSGVEASYFGIYDWSASDYVSEPVRKLRVPDVMGARSVSYGVDDYTYADAMTITYDVKLNSVELNLTFSPSDYSDNVISGLFGIRFFRFDEEMNIRAYVSDYSVFYSTPTSMRGGYSDYQINTTNEMFGVQGGAKFQRCVAGRLEVEGFAKLGIYNNNAQQETRLNYWNRYYVLRNENPEQSVAAFAGDFNLSAKYRLNHNWSLRCGYSVLLLSGIARAPDQLDFTNSILATSSTSSWTASGSSSGSSGSGSVGNTATNTVINSDRIFFREQALIHGLNLGLEGRF